MKTNEPMKKAKTSKAIPEQTVPVDFKEQTPEVQIGEPKNDPLYEKAFLSRDDKNTSEYAQNTTTWD